jgi:CheY-like chemotaxis protein
MMSMLKVFILEDDPERIRRFRESLLGAHIVDNVTDAIEALKNNNFDTLLLDHDLGGEIFVPMGNQNTGSGLARWMSDNVDKYPQHIDAQIIIHSYNPGGSDNMLSTLLTAGYTCVSKIPFYKLFQGPLGDDTTAKDKDSSNV